MSVTIGAGRRLTGTTLITVVRPAPSIWHRANEVHLDRGGGRRRIRDSGRSWPRRTQGWSAFATLVRGPRRPRSNKTTPHFQPWHKCNERADSVAMRAAAAHAVRAIPTFERHVTVVEPSGPGHQDRQDQQEWVYQGAWVLAPT